MLDWWLPENVSTYGREIDWLFHLIYYITGVTFILVFVTMLAFLVMYRDRPGRKARYTHGNTTLEIVWTVVPALILVILTLLSVPAWSKIKMTMPETDFVRSEEHTSELQSHSNISYAVFCLKKKKKTIKIIETTRSGCYTRFRKQT